MALAWLLSRLHAQGVFPKIDAVTVDHDLRAGSAEEARQVGSWLSGWAGVSHTVLTRPAPEEKTRIMERARRDRYRLLQAFCRERNTRHLFVAHHADDQAETFLMRLAKGSGLDGLAGMKPVHRKDGVDICRPLLQASKTELVTLCEHEDIPFIIDPSNENPAYARSRLRAVRDALKAEGLTADRLAVTASRIGRARQALEFYAEETERKALIENDRSRILFDMKILMSAPEDIRLRVILRAVRAIRNASGSREDHDYGPRMDRLEALAGCLFSSDPPASVTLGRCLFRADIKQNYLTIESE